MVRAYHVIFTTYGFWLPNDPRGSWSDYVAKWELYKYGPATKVRTRRSLARDPHDRQRRIAPKKELKYPPVTFNGLQARAVARGFANLIEHLKLNVAACAIMPDHVHVVFERCGVPAERIVTKLKSAATKQLILEGGHPLAKYVGDGAPVPRMWVRGSWQVFLSTEPVIVRAIRYVEQNPVKDGKRKQNWNYQFHFWLRCRHRHIKV